MGKKRARKAASALFDLAVDMEEPLNDTFALMRALRLTGEGMVAEANTDCGEPVIAVAEAAMRRLEDLGGIWTELFGAASKVKTAI